MREKITLEQLVAKLKGRVVSGSEGVEPEVNPKLREMFPPERVERIKKKELRRFREAQDKKWRNWLEEVSK